MGYISKATGEITYFPALPESELENNEILLKYSNGDEYDIFLVSDWNGISGPEDTFKAYWIKDSLTELVSEMLRINPEITFRGYIQINGEGDGQGGIDLWRLQVKHGKVEEIKPKLVWPED